MTWDWHRIPAVPGTRCASAAAARATTLNDNVSHEAISNHNTAGDCGHARLNRHHGYAVDDAGDGHSD